MKVGSFLSYLLVFLLVVNIGVQSVNLFYLRDLRAHVLTLKQGGAAVVNVVDAVTGGVVQKGALAVNGFRAGVDYVKKKLKKSKQNPENI